MLLLVTYDVNTISQDGQRRLRKVAKCCEAHGQRVQNSVFECSLNEAQYVTLRSKLESIINPKTDSLRFYNLGNKHESRIMHVGAKHTYDPQGALIF